ncbi:MAG: PKD domain-containing protein, partial [Actinobacteria bacterium]|nr:PKD domain-containing protein [Actinomycetota bacterium]
MRALWRRTGLVGMIAATATAALAGWAPAALAAPTWLAPLDLSAAGGHTSSPDVAMNGAGDSVAVWGHSNGTNSVVQAAVRPAGGSFLATVDLSAAGQEAFSPQVALDAAGDTVAVWERSDGTNNVVQAAFRPANGPFSAPVDVSATGENAFSPQIALDAAGNAIVVWRRFTGTNSVVQAAVRPAGGSFSTPVDVSATGQNAFSPQVAVNAAGAAIAVWQRDNGTNTIIQAAVRPAGGSFSAPVDVSASTPTPSNSECVIIDCSQVPQVALDAAGDAVAVWRRSNGTNYVVQAAVRPTGGAFSAPVDLSAAGQDASVPQVALDAAGDAVAVWKRSNGSNYVVQAAVRPAGGSFSAPVDLSAPGQEASEPRVALDAAGDAVAVWERFNGSNFVVQAAVRPAGGAFSTPVDVSAAGQDAFSPQMAIDAAGDAIAVWGRSNAATDAIAVSGRSNAATNSIVQVAGYDAAGPQLRNLTIPASGVVGAPLTFAVTPVDVWSDRGATTWAFGDGASATATATTHTYTTAGTFTVTVNAADKLANTTSATRTITIARSAQQQPKPTLATISGLRLTPSTFRAARSGPSITSKRPKRTGSRISYTLNTAATVRITIQRASRGRRAGKRCTKPTRANRKHKRCTRYSTLS